MIDLERPQSNREFEVDESPEILSESSCGSANSSSGNRIPSKYLDVEGSATNLDLRFLLKAQEKEMSQEEVNVKAVKPFEGIKKAKLDSEIERFIHEKLPQSTFKANEQLVARTNGKFSLISPKQDYPVRLPLKSPKEDTIIKAFENLPIKPLKDSLVVALLDKVPIKSPSSNANLKSNERILIKTPKDEIFKRPIEKLPLKPTQGGLSKSTAQVSINSPFYTNKSNEIFLKESPKHQIPTVSIENIQPDKIEKPKLNKSEYVENIINDRLLKSYPEQINEESKVFSANRYDSYIKIQETAIIPTHSLNSNSSEEDLWVAEDTNIVYYENGQHDAPTNDKHQLTNQSPLSTEIETKFLDEKRVPGLSNSESLSQSSSNRDILNLDRTGNSSPLRIDNGYSEKDLTSSDDDSDLDIMKRIRKHIECSSSESDQKYSPILSQGENRTSMTPNSDLHLDSDVSNSGTENDKLGDVNEENFLESIESSETEENIEEVINQVIYNEIEMYLQLIPFQELGEQIDPSLNFIDEYLDVMLSQLLPCENEILDSINTPAYHDPMGRLSLLQNAEIGSLVKYPTLDLILPPELCTELKSAFNALEIPARQIYLQMLYDCVNEALNYIRPYGTIGVPDPWSIRRRTLFGESQLINVFQRVKEHMYRWGNLKGGGYPTSDMVIGGMLDENRLQILREEKMSGLLCQDVQDEENNWLDYEEEEVQVKLDMADMVLESLVDETVKLLNMF